MKRKRIMETVIALCLAIGLFLIPDMQITVRAAQVIATVTGTVVSDTTPTLLYLSTKDGVMQIKLDSGTDVSECKLLLPDKNVTVSVSHGSDGYLHAVKISDGPETPKVSVDTSSPVTVTGTLDKKSRGDLLYLNTAQGTMEIRFDSTTDLSKVRMLVAGQSYSIKCGRGSDAYMHALSITDGVTGGVSGNSSSNSSGTSSSSTTPAPAKNAPAATAAVLGTVAGSTKEGLLYLSTSSGEMQFVIDAYTDTRNGLVLVPDNQLIISYYRGSDAYMHAVTVMGIKGVDAPAQVDTSSTALVGGTVGGKSTQDILYLETQYGVMEIKLDTLQSVSGCKAFVVGKWLNVSCARGSDAYMHAVSITAG